MVMDKLLKYLNSLSKRQRATFVEGCATSESYLRKAICIGQRLGCRLCGAIERESGGLVLRQDLRPHDWRKLWPDLDQAAGADTAPGEGACGLPEPAPSRSTVSPAPPAPAG